MELFSTIEIYARFIFQTRIYFHSSNKAWARFLRDLFFGIDKQEKMQDLVFLEPPPPPPTKPREDGDGMEATDADDEFLECEDASTEFDHEAIVECLLGLLLESEKGAVSSEIELGLSELFLETQEADPPPKPLDSKETQTEPDGKAEPPLPPVIEIGIEDEIDESLLLLFGEEASGEEGEEEAAAPPARASPTSSVGLMFSWVAQSLGSILSAPHPTPSLAVLRPGTPIGAEATLLPILQGNLVKSRVVL
jgi:hypothetical protein